MRASLAILFFLTLSTISRPSMAADFSPELVKRCKLATALVHVVDQAEGTAFHIGGGVFLTNYHVVEDGRSGAKIELILNSGEKSQRVLKAQLLRLDEKMDLALLKVDEKELPPALEVGESEGLVETMSVAVFGFPFGSELAVGKAAFPNMSVNLGRITALRKAENQLEAIQFDATISPGNSGGPLVGSDGKVIGVVQAHVPGSALGFAIPADRIRRFLFGTGIVFKVDRIQFDPGVASNFNIEILGQQKESSDLSVTIRFSSFAQDQREYKGVAAGKDAFTFTAPLLPAIAADDLNADIEDQGEQWSIRVKDQPVRIAGRTLQLREIREVRQGAASSIELVSGATLAGTVTGLKNLACIRNGKPSTVDLSRVQRIRLSKPSGASSKLVNYEISVRAAGKVLATQKGIITPDGIRPEVVHELPEERDPVTDLPGGKSNVPPGVPIVKWEKNGHYYAAIHTGENMLWVEAYAIASRLVYKGKKGHLATVTSHAENLFILANFPHPREIALWLGGYRDKSAPDAKGAKDGWRWVTGEPWEYTNWANGEPNGGQAENYYLHYFEDGAWDDAYWVSELKFGFIVEFE